MLGAGDPTSRQDVQEMLCGLAVAWSLGSWNGCVMPAFRSLILQESRFRALQRTPVCREVGTVRTVTSQVCV